MPAQYKTDSEGNVWKWNEKLGKYVLWEKAKKVADTRHPKADQAEKKMMRDEG